jgi:hypothetical protein
MSFACLFKLQEEAVAFARKYGWEYSLEEPQQRNPIRQKRFAGYGDNFRCGGSISACSMQQLVYVSMAAYQGCVLSWCRQMHGDEGT